jgi:hypothetical protein
MFEISVEPDLSLMTVTRTGIWTLATVKSYESALKRELRKLRESGRPTSFIIDIRSTEPTPRDVAIALREVVDNLGDLRADRIAIVSSSGVTKLEAAQFGHYDTQVFTSTVLARDWVTSRASTLRPPVYDEPSGIEAEGKSVHVTGPAAVDFNLTPAAALEMSKRMEDVAVEVLVGSAGRAMRAQASGGRRP